MLLQDEWMNSLGGHNSNPDDLLIRYKDLLKDQNPWFTDQVIGKVQNIFGRTFKIYFVIDSLFKT